MTLDLADLLDSWTIALRAARKSPHTIDSYTTGVRLFLAWAASSGVPAELDKRTVSTWIGSLLDAGAEPATASSRLRGVRRFSAWLAEEREIPEDLLLGLRGPKIDDKVVPRLTDDQIRALLKACDGATLRDRRDAALLRLMLETAMRAGEAVGLAVPDVDLTRGLAIVRRGKGGIGRTVPFGATTAQALDRYLRVRRRHALADTDALWLGDNSRGFGYSGLHRALSKRAEAAGIEGFHPHVLRHTAAQRWLAAEGSEGGLMAVAGWKRREMLDRYTRASAAERAAEESRRLNLGDF